MNCPFCTHNESKVIDSREAGEGVRRRRECLMCSLRFTTYERLQMLILQVAKRDTRREQFNRDKLTRSLQKACAKRPLPTGTVEKIVEEIDLELQRLGKAEIPSSLIGEMAVERLKYLDRVAYIRYASVYKDFRDIETFKEEVEALLTTKENGITNNQLPLIPTEELFPSRKRRRGRPRIFGIQTD